MKGKGGGIDENTYIRMGRKGEARRVAAVFKNAGKGIIITLGIPILEIVGAKKSRKAGGELVQRGRKKILSAARLEGWPANGVEELLKKEPTLL